MEPTDKRIASADEMRAFFDRLAPNWENDASEAEIRDEIVRRAGIAKGSVIADIGCGRGVMVPHLLKTEPGRLIEIDVSSEMLRLCEKEWKRDGMEFVCGNLYELRLAGLDAAVLFNAYPHFMDKKALSETLYQCLKPGGTLVIAHSKGKEAINGFHREGTAFTLSIKLKSAEEEYEAFREQFELVEAEDNERIYFLDMKRRS